MGEEAPLGELVIPPRGHFRRADGQPYLRAVEAQSDLRGPNLTSAAAAAATCGSWAADGGLPPLRTYGMFSVDLRAAGSASSCTPGWWPCARGRRPDPDAGPRGGPEAVVR